MVSEEVIFKRKHESELNKEDGNRKIKRKNGFQLGVDSVLETKNSMVLSPKLEVTIGPISEKKINNYLKKDGVLKFINTFYDYFIPMEVDVFTEFTLISEDGFLLDAINSPLMGISTQL